jgi:hypothetical protein
MPPPFQDLDLSEFSRLLTRFPFERRVTAVHLHHAGHVRRTDWRGYETLRAMWYTHTLQQGWSDLAQHLTIDPTGTVWTGRDWNRPPCSAPNQNGDARSGPFMITLIGDFNTGGDCFDTGSVQYARTIEIIARLQLAFALEPHTLRFHRDMDRSKKCPGETIDLGQLIDAVAQCRADLTTKGPAVAPPGGPPPFGEDVEAWYQFIIVSSQNRGLLYDEPPDFPRSTGEPPTVDAGAAGSVQ